MAKQKKQSIIEREKNKKGNGTISKVQLISCYVVSALIVILCVVEALKPETQATGNPGVYYFLAAVGIGYSIYITVRNNAAKKKPSPAGKRLQ
jgi:hypothetical protein